MSTPSQAAAKSPLYFSTRDLLIMAVLAALGGVASTYINTLGDAIHAALGLPGATQWAAGLHIIWIVLSVGILKKPGTGTMTGLFKGAVELMSGNSHGVIILLVDLVAGLLVDFVFLLFHKKRTLWPYLFVGGLASGSNVIVFQIFATVPMNILGLSAILILFVVAFISGLIFAGLIPFYLVASLSKAGVIRIPERPSSPSRKLGWGIILGVFLLAVLLAIFLRVNIRGPQAISIDGAISNPFQYSAGASGITLETRQMPYRDVMTEYQGYPLKEIILVAEPEEYADTVLIEASDGYTFLVSFDELLSNENILLVQNGRGQNASLDIVGPGSSKAWVRNVTCITVIAAQGLEVIGLDGNIQSFDPEAWTAEMDSTQVALPDGNQKLQGVPVWKVLKYYSNGRTPGQVSFSSAIEHITVSWGELAENDDLRIFTVIAGEQIKFTLATMSGEVQLFPLISIEVQP